MDISVTDISELLLTGAEVKPFSCDGLQIQVKADKHFDTPDARDIANEGSLFCRHPNPGDVQLKQNQNVLSDIQNKLQTDVHDFLIWNTSLSNLMPMISPYESPI